MKSPTFYNNLFLNSKMWIYIVLPGLPCLLPPVFGFDSRLGVLEEQGPR